MIDTRNLLTMLNLINVVSQRGAFRGEELEDVGTLYNTIKTEVERLQQLQQLEEEPEVDVSDEVLG
jgi:hypothetical protein